MNIQEMQLSLIMITIPTLFSVFASGIIVWGWLVTALVQKCQRSINNYR
jgi:hypothetical protein